MTKKELIEKLEKFDDNAEIIAFNYTSFRWYKTEGKENYSFYTVEDLIPKVDGRAKKQLSKFQSNDIAFVL